MKTQANRNSADSTAAVAPYLRAPSLLFAIALSACGGDSDEVVLVSVADEAAPVAEPPLNPGEASAAGGLRPQQEGSRQSDGSSGPRFAFISQVFGSDGSDNQSYIVLADSLEAGGSLSLNDAVEVPGRAIGGGVPGAGAVFVAGDAGPTITRYELNEQRLERGETLSFIGQGMAGFGEYGGQFHFASEETAYFFDGPTAQIVRWNPRSMTVVGTEPLPELVFEGELLTFSASPLQVGDTLLQFASWRAGPEVPSRSAVVILDTETGAADVVLDERCGYVRDGALGDDGWVYLATEAYASAVHLLGEKNAAVPCLLRFDPETKSFDGDYRVNLSSLVGGATAGSLVRGAEGSTFLRVLDSEAFPVTDATPPRLLASAAAWGWARLTLGDTPSAQLLTTPASSGSVIMLDLGLGPVAALYEGRQSTELIALGPEGLESEGLGLPGLVFAATAL